VEGSQQKKFQDRQYEELYNVAMYSASERTRSLRRTNNQDNEGFFDDWQKIALTSLASILITSVVCIMIFCCIRKSRKGRTHADPSSESDVEVPRRGQRSAVENDVQVSDFSESDQSNPGAARSFGSQQSRSLQQHQRSGRGMNP